MLSRSNSHDQSYAGNAYGQRSSSDYHQHHAQGMADVNAPHAVSKEMFINVTVLSIEEENPLKNVTNWMGNLMKGNQTVQKSHNRFQEIMPDIVNMVRSAVYAHGWVSDVEPVMLPPAHGENRWAPFLRMGEEELPIFIAFRVQLRTKVAERSVGNQAYNGHGPPGAQQHGAYHGGHPQGGGFFQSLMACCEMFVSPFPISGEEYESIGMEIQDGLRRLKRAIRAQTEVVDAPGEYNILHSKGWNPELCSQAVLQSRHQSNAGAGYAGNGAAYGSPGQGGGYGSPGHGGSYGAPGMAGMGNSPRGAGMGGYR